MSDAHEMTNHLSDIEYSILHSLGEEGQPMGSGSLHYMMRKRGSRMSAPTIGRKLRDLEHSGLVAKVSVEGRTLTPAGQKLLESIERERKFQLSGEHVLKLLKRNGKKDIVDTLMARRAIEGETCALAASRITPEELGKLIDLIAEQRKMIERGESGAALDVSFHDTIAQLSGNSVLAGMVIMLRSQERLNSIVTAIRVHVGTRPVVDHEKILKALKTGKAETARRAMEQHLNRLIADVEKYWEEVFHHGSRG